MPVMGHNLRMPNIANVLKDEIARVARKELRQDTAALKKASSAYRADIAALKRRIETLERSLKQLGKLAAKAAPAAPEPTAVESLRFSAKGLASHRVRLGLSLAEAARLLETSGQSVRNWETGKVPRRDSLPSIAAFRKLGKREATARLKALAEA